MTTVKEDPAYANFCLGCMTDKGGDLECRKCGYDDSKAEAHQLRIKPRSILKDQYLIGRVLGQGGFGITYLGLDLLLHKKVAIKEFLPSMLATRDSDKTTVVPFSGSQEQFFQQGLHSFIGEARSVAHFSRHINIVNVNNYFEANQTGYMVMDYLEGEPVSRIMAKRGGRLPLSEAFAILFPVLDALNEVHKMDIYHRDISPQNIIVTTNNIPVLIDFGAARQIVGEQSYSLDVVLKHGYSPLEQYTSKGKIGPWSDVYACGATLYHMITGKLPPPAIDRVYSDELIMPSQIECLNISEELNDTILTSLAVRTSDRYQSIEELKEALARKGYVGYRRLLDGFLRDKKEICLEDRMVLDRFIVDHRLDHDDTKLIEETLREEMDLPPVDWISEYRENYEKYRGQSSGESQESIDGKFRDTYVNTKRISRRKTQEIKKGLTEARPAPVQMPVTPRAESAPEQVTVVSEAKVEPEQIISVIPETEPPSEQISVASEAKARPERQTVASEAKPVPEQLTVVSEPKAALEQMTVVSEPKAAPEKVAAISGAESKAAPEKIVVLPQAKPAQEKKSALLKIAAAACVVIAIGVFFIVRPKPVVEPPAGKGTAPPAAPLASGRNGLINVWSQPPAQIYVNGKSVGLSPQSKIEVPSGEVTIRLLSKEHNIDETYTEFVEPASSRATN